MIQDGPRDRWILHQCRTAVFFLAECWAALGAMERLLERDNDSPDAMGTFFQLHSLFSGRDLYALDLSLFLNGVRELSCSTTVGEQLLKKCTRIEILEQLRKANWTYDQVVRLSNVVARRIKLHPEVVLQQFSELAFQAIDGPLTMEHVDNFLLTTSQWFKCSKGLPRSA